MQITELSGGYIMIIIILLNDVYLFCQRHKKTEGKIPSVCTIKKQLILCLTLTYDFDWN